MRHSKLRQKMKTKKKTQREIYNRVGISWLLSAAGVLHLKLCNDRTRTTTNASFALHALVTVRSLYAKWWRLSQTRCGLLIATTHTHTETMRLRDAYIVYSQFNSLPPLNWLNWYQFSRSNVEEPFYRVPLERWMKSECGYYCACAWWQTSDVLAFIHLPTFDFYD